VLKNAGRRQASRVIPRPTLGVNRKDKRLSFEDVVLESPSFATSGANSAVVENAVSSE